MQHLFDVINANWATIITVLFLVSEILAFTPLKANSVFQLIFGWLKKEKEKLPQA